MMNNLSEKGSKMFTITKDGKKIRHSLLDTLNSTDELICAKIKVFGSNGILITDINLRRNFGHKDLINFFIEVNSINDTQTITLIKGTIWLNNGAWISVADYITEYDAKSPKQELPRNVKFQRCGCPPLPEN